jgi:hypothetical protein
MANASALKGIRSFEMPARLQGVTSQKLVLSNKSILCLSAPVQRKQLLVERMSETFCDNFTPQMALVVDTTCLHNFFFSIFLHGAQALGFVD